MDGEQDETTIPTRLLTGGQIGDPEIFAPIFAEFSSKLYRYAIMHVGNREDAEDIVASTFVRLLEYGIRYPRSAIDAPQAFLYRIARNLIIDGSRRRRPTTSLEQLSEQGIEFPDVGKMSEEVKVEVALVIGKMGTLGIEDRDMLLLRFVEDFPLKHIATLYDITENNVAVKIHRALQKLKEVVVSK